VLAVLKSVLLAVAGGLWLAGSGLSSKLDGFEKIVISIGLGVALAVLVGCVSLILGFSHVDIITLCLTFVLFILFLVKRNLTMPRLKLTIERQYWVPVSLFSVHVLFFVLYLYAFPFFPGSDAMDVVWHIYITNAVLHGQIVAPATETGSHILFAYFYSFLGGGLLDSLRISTAAIEAFSVLVAYCMFHRLFRQFESAAYATVAFSLIVPAGLFYYTSIGAYPNIIGDFFVLLSLFFFLIVSQNISKLSILTMVVIETLALISHISVLIFGGLMLSFSVFIYKSNRDMFKSYALANVGFLILPIAVLVISPGLLIREIGYVSNLNYIGLQDSPALILRTWFDNYVFLAGPINFGLVWIALVMAVTKMRKQWESLLLAAWFTLLFLAIFFGSNGSRFVLLSFLPGAGLIGLLLLRIDRSISRLARWIRVPRVRRIFTGVTMICIIFVLIATGSAARMATETYLADGMSRQNQLLIYESMQWLASNSNSDAAVISIGLQKEYRYLPTLFNRTYVGDYDLPPDNQNPSNLLAVKSVMHFNYIVITTNFNGIQNYYQCKALRSVFRNSQVTIFALTNAVSCSNGTG